MGVYDRPEQYEYRPPYDIHEYQKEWELCNGEWERERRRRKKEVNHRLTLEEGTTHE